MNDIADVLAAYLNHSGPCRLWVLVADLQWPENELTAALSNRRRFHWGKDCTGPLVGLRKQPWFNQYED